MPDRRHLYLSILDAQHWVRAAQALSAIGGEGARAALEAAASLPSKSGGKADIPALTLSSNCGRDPVYSITSIAAVDRVVNLTVGMRLRKRSLFVAPAERPHKG
jgi:hypothetical protein